MNTVLKNNINDFMYNIIEFGSLDIKRAVDVAIEVGENGDWVAEQVREFAGDTGIPLFSCDLVCCVYDTILQEARNEIPLFSCDVVCCVYDTILQEARNEISSLTGFDFCNDDAEIYTAGNYLATSYDWSRDANEIIRQKLIENEIVFDELSAKTQWFLEQIEANY